MKQIIVIVFLFLVGYGDTNAQKKDSTILSFKTTDPLGPIVTYNDKNSLNAIKLLAYGKSDTSQYWRGSAVQLVKDKLLLKGDTVGAKAFTVDSIFAHLEFEEEKLKDSTFFNSGWNFAKKRIDFYLSKKSFEGWVGVVYYRGLRIVLFKLNCLNLFMVKEPVVITIPKDKPVAKIPEKTDTSGKNCCCTTINNYNYYGPIPPVTTKSDPNADVDMKDIKFHKGNDNGFTTEVGWKQDDKIYLVDMPNQYCDGSYPWLERGARVAFRLDVNFGTRQYGYCPPGSNQFRQIPDQLCGFLNLQVSNRNWNYQPFAFQQGGRRARYYYQDDIGDRNKVIYPTRGIF